MTSRATPARFRAALAGRRAPKHRSGHTYWQQVHIQLVAVLVLLTAALTVVGLMWLPPSVSFPQVPQGLEMYLTTTGQTAVTATLQLDGDGGSVLTVEENDPPTDPVSQAHVRWQALFEDLSGARLCTDDSLPMFDVSGSPTFNLPSPALGRPVLVSLGRFARVPLTPVTGTNALLFSLCWKSNGPVASHGAYLSAWFPPPVSTYPPTGYPPGLLMPGPGRPITSMTRVLSITSDTYLYTLQSQFSPADATEQSWQWSNDVPVGDIVHVTAINQTVTQHETYLSFLSGIAFGIGGGAVITILQELLDPLSRRRDRRSSTEAS